MAPSSQATGSDSQSPFAGRKVILGSTSSDGVRGVRLSTGTAGDPVLAKGSEVAFVVDLKCLADRRAASQPGAFLTDRYPPPASGAPMTGHLSYDAALTVDTPIKQFTDDANADRCLIGVAQIQSGLATHETSGATPAYLAQLEWAAAEPFFKASLGGTKAVVAVLDTGMDLKNVALDPGTLAPDLSGTNLLTGSNDPQDDNGHGTSVMSLITAKPSDGSPIRGIAAGHVVLVPIKIADRNAAATNVDVFNGIMRAVSLGADVVNISMGALTTGCDPVMGQAIYQALSSGVFVVMSAGNGKAVPPGAAVGVAVNGAKNDGSDDGVETDSPACWGGYYKGAVAVGALNTGTSTLARFSNFGPGVEIAAPGTAIPTFSLNNAQISADGTSMAAAEVTAAVALAIAYHKAKGWKHPPGLIEQVLVEGSKTIPELRDGVARGTVLDLKSIGDYLNGPASDLQSLYVPTNAQPVKAPTNAPVVNVQGQGEGQDVLGYIFGACHYNIPNHPEVCDTYESGGVGGVYDPLSVHILISGESFSTGIAYRGTDFFPLVHSWCKEIHNALPTSDSFFNFFAGNSWPQPNINERDKIRAAALQSVTFEDHASCPAGSISFKAYLPGAAAALAAQEAAAVPPTPTPTPAGPPAVAPAGLFRVSGTVYYSNGNDAFCSFVSLEHLTSITGRTDANGAAVYSGTPTGMRNDGSCKYTYPTGYFIAAGTVYYSNGNDAFCGYVSWEHFTKLTGLGSTNGFPTYSALFPTNMRNDGACKYTYPAGFFIVGGTTIYYSNGNDAFCVFASWASYLAHGGPADTSTLPSYSALLPTNMRNDGVCQ